MSTPAIQGTKGNESNILEGGNSRNRCAIRGRQVKERARAALYLPIWEWRFPRRLAVFGEPDVDEGGQVENVDDAVAVEIGGTAFCRDRLAHRLGE